MTAAESGYGRAKVGSYFRRMNDYSGMGYAARRFLTPKRNKSGRKASSNKTLADTKAANAMHRSAPWDLYLEKKGQAPARRVAYARCCCCGPSLIRSRGSVTPVCTTAACDPTSLLSALSFSLANQIQTCLYLCLHENPCHPAPPGLDG